MKYLNKIVLIYLIIFINTINSIAGENRILLKVNNEIITSVDIATEINYLKIINKDYQKLDKIRAIEIAKNSIIREKIKFIELSKLNNKGIQKYRILVDFGDGKIASVLPCILKVA